MGAVADEIPRAPAEGQEIGEGGRRARTPELSRDAWKDLFAQVTAGDPAGLQALYHVAGRRIFGLALWRTGSVEDAGDVVQEVFLRVVEGRHRLAKVVDPRSWLLSVAHHVAVDVARRRKRSRSDSLEDAPLLVAPESDCNPIDAARASRLLTQLPPAQRDAIYLRHYEDCTFETIGRITGVPTFTAASRYRLGIARLRRLMERKR
jgi:RNA polymerase sigma-70 factor (ECF subfamily)